MNGLERTMAALRGERPDRIPVMLHNFMMAARQAGMTQAEYRHDPRNIARAMRKAVETFRYDGILVDLDTATLAGAVGVLVDYPDDEPARCVRGCLDDLARVGDLAPPEVDRNEQIQVWLEAVRLLVDQIGGEFCIRGNCDQAPFSLASMVRGPQNWMMDLIDPDSQPHVFALLNYCAEATAQFVRLMAETGAHVVSNGDSPAGPEMISPAMYREFALPYEQRTVEVAHAAGLPYVLHICGNTTPILQDVVRSGADGIELDYKTDVQGARDLLAGKMCFLGNIDPSGVLALGTVADVERETAKLLAVFADTPGFILNAGCAIPPNTPAENIRAIIRVARG